MLSKTIWTPITILAIWLIVQALYIPIYEWDECRQVVNAMEMHDNHNFLVVYFNNTPDLYNTKPPLLVWLMTFFISILGYNVLVFRLVSIIATLITVIYSARFISKKYGERYALICTVILVSSKGYIGYHAAGTADFDALLTLFSTIGAIELYKYSETRNNRDLVYSFIAFTLAVFTKTIAGVLIIPGIVVFFCIKRKLSYLFFNKYFYILLYISVSLILTYYLTRDHFNAGYITAVIENDLLGRFTKAQQENGGPFTYYVTCLYTQNYRLWAQLFVALFLPFAIIKKVKTDDFTRYCLCIIFTFLLVISCSKTKLAWYIVPAYPFFAMCMAAMAYHLADAFPSIFKRNFIMGCLIPVCAAILFTLNILDISSFYKNNWYQQKNGPLLEALHKEYPNTKKVTFIAEEYYGHTLSYTKMAEHNWGANCRILYTLVNISIVGDTLIAANTAVIDTIKTRYILKPVADVKYFGNIYKVESVDTNVVKQLMIDKLNLIKGDKAWITRITSTTEPSDLNNKVFDIALYCLVYVDKSINFEAEKFANKSLRAQFKNSN